MGVATFKCSFLPFLIFCQCQPYGTGVYILTAALLGHFDCSFFALHLLMSWPSTTTKSGIKNYKGSGVSGGRY